MDNSKMHLFCFWQATGLSSLIFHGCYNVLNDFISICFKDNIDVIPYVYNINVMLEFYFIPHIIKSTSK